MPGSLVLAVALVACTPSTASALQQPACLGEATRLLPEGDVDSFGQAVSMHGDTAAVGSPGDDMGRGSVHVFMRRDGAWVEAARLQPGDAMPGDHFGASVSVDGDILIAGAPDEDGVGPASGAAYVFVQRGSTWSEQAKLVPAAGAPEDVFGASVAVRGNTAVVGAPWHDELGTNSGCAYAYVRHGATWHEQAKLLASDGAAGDAFGWSVSLDEDAAAIGAPYADGPSGVASGCAYVFARSGASWSQQARLVAPDAGSGDEFGCSLAVSGERIVVGARSDDDAGFQSGSAYVYARGGGVWHEEAGLLAEDGQPGDRFGASVGLSGDLAVIGAPSESSAGFHAGTAYAFARSGAGWSQHARLDADDAAAGDRAGHAVAASGGRVVVGILFGDVPDDGSGSAVVYEVPPPAGTVYCTCAAGPCGNPDPDAGCAHSLGTGARLTGYGSTLPDEVHLRVTGARPGQPAMFFEGTAAAQLPFGDGLRCVGGSVVRILPATAVDLDGSAGFGPCFGDPPLSSVTGVVPGSGQGRRYQLWYRDAGGPCGTGFNLTNGYEITW